MKKRWDWKRRLPWLWLIGGWMIVALLWPKVPSPIQIFSLVVQDLADRSFLTALAGSMFRMAVGYTAVCVIGVNAGLLLGRFRWLDDLLGTLVSALNAMPGAAWVPLAIVLFGPNQAAVIFTILLGATGIVVVNTSFGVRDVPPLILRAAQTMGAKGTKIFWHVIVPAATPRIVDGLRLAWAFGWRALMAGELLISSIRGMGQLINQVAHQRNTKQLLAFMVIIALIGMFVDGVIFNRLIGNRLRTRWGAA